MKKLLTTVFCVIVCLGQFVYGQEELEVDGAFTADIKLTAPGSKYLRFHEGGSLKGIFGHSGTDLFLWNYESGGDLNLGVNSGTDMTIEDGGFIGMGTTNPEENLHIVGSGNCDLRMEAGGAKYIRFYEGTAQKAFLGHSGTDIVISNFETSGDIVFGVDGGVQEMVLETGGELGVGTLAPEARLHIHNGDGLGVSSANSLIDLVVEDNSSSYIGFNASGWAGCMFNDDGSLYRAGYLFNTSSDRLSMKTGGVDNRMSVEEDGLVGINDITPSAMLHIKQQGSDEEGLAIENDGDTDTWSFEVGSNDLNIYFNDTYKGAFDDNTGNYTASDLRLKKNIEVINDGALDKLMKLVAKTYHYNHDETMDRKAYGFIAQEVREIFPDFVQEVDDGSGLLSLNYGNVGVVTVKALQELNDKVARLEKELTKKHEELVKKEKENEALKANFEQRLAKLEAAQK